MKHDFFLFNDVPMEEICEVVQPSGENKTKVCFTKN